jgi:coproporphyrinogen III oxidase-like Fe-S oxidoreductase
MMSLRTAEGCDLHKLKSQYDYDLAQQKDDRIEALIRHGFGMFEGNKLLLLTKGKLLVDSITADLFWA